jgi:hypothetical protein
VSECGGNKQPTHAQKQTFVYLLGAMFDEGGKIVNVGSKNETWNVVLVA